MPSAPISAAASSCCRAMPLRWTTVSPLACAVDVLELAAEPQLDVGMVVDLRLQRALQVGAMHHPIGRAGAKGWRPRRAAAGRSRRRARALMMLMASGVTARGASRGCRPRSTRMRLALGESCRPAPASSSRSAFSRTMTRKPCRGERKRRRQSPDPGTSDDDGARGRHRSIRRPCLSARIPAGGPRRRRGRRRSDTASSNRGR